MSAKELILGREHYCYSVLASLHLKDAAAYLITSRVPLLLTPSQI